MPDAAAQPLPEESEQQQSLVRLAAGCRPTIVQVNAGERPFTIVELDGGATFRVNVPVDVHVKHLKAAIQERKPNLFAASALPPCPSTDSASWVQGSGCICAGC